MQLSISSQLILHTLRSTASQGRPLRSTAAVAARLGLPREIVIRALADLERAGLVGGPRLSLTLLGLAVAQALEARDPDARRWSSGASRAA